MEFIIGKTAGFCYGVKRAIDGAEKIAEKEKKVYCIGEIIHNENVINYLRKKGVIFINSIDDVKGKLLIRAHGESKDTYKKIKNKNIEIEDLTCLNVLKTHEIAEKYSKNGFFIIFLGIKGHPEAKATLSFCGEKSCIVQEKEEIEDALYNIKKEKIDNILIMAQTTYNSKKFESITKAIKEKLDNKNIVVEKTICSATEIRQKETEQISKKVNCMVIIGDKRSSNTNKLYDIAKENCSKVFFVQNSNEIKKNEFKNYKLIGVMAGASTPKKDIKEVVDKIKEINE